MNITRRGFLRALAGLGAAAMAPAIVRAENIMRVRPILTPTLEECWVYGAQLDGSMGGKDLSRAIFSVFIKRDEKEGWVRKSVNVPRGAPIGISPGGHLITPQGHTGWGQSHWTTHYGHMPSLDRDATRLKGHRDAAIFVGDNVYTIESKGHEFAVLGPKWEYQ